MGSQTVPVHEGLNASKVIPLLSFCIFFNVLNGTMFNVAIPSIAEEFQLLPSQVSWVVAGYIILFAIGSVTYGKLADSYPVKNLITIGLILFNLGSLIGFLSNWYPMLIAARLIQASGAAAVPALAMFIATRYFPANSRGRVLGVIASTVAFGSGIGPILGGFITGTFHWRFLFLFSLISFVAVFPFRKWLPAEKIKPASKFDITGALLLGGGISFLLLSLTQPNTWYFPSSIVLLATFIVHIRRVKNPLIQPDLFRIAAYRNGLITGFLAVGTVFGMMLMIPLMLHEVNGLDSKQIGYIMFPGAMSAALFGMVSGRMAGRVGSIPIVGAGLGLLLLGYFLLSTFVGWNSWVIGFILIICYTGFSSIQSSLANTVSNTLPAEQIGVGMGLYNLVFFISGAFGSSIVGKILDYSTMGFTLNPLSQGTAVVYSNVFMMFIAVVLTSGIVYIYTFLPSMTSGLKKDKQARTN
jgi:DHA2 family metal-tetracycline-proton antiporter-like MFS transporter